jgi:S-formylglutathione hydrolase FrmB
VFVLGCGASKSGTTENSETGTEEQKKVAGLAGEVEVPRGEIITARFLSESLGVKKRYFAYMPARYAESGKRYPVVYMLHGLGGSEDNWSKYMKLTEAADAMQLQAIVIMPDGDNSFYMNSATKADFEACSKDTPPEDNDCVKNANFEDYIVKDLVAHVDATYRTKAEVTARAIGGLSMGGYGALMLGMLHKDVFSSVASHSGVASLLYTGPIPHAPGKAQLADDPIALTQKMGRFGAIFLGIFGDKIENWRAHDPAKLAGTLRDGDLAIYIDCGTEDEFKLQHGASYLHEVLESASITHSFTLLPGRHNAAFWGDRIDDSLAFHVSHFVKTGALAGPLEGRPLAHPPDGRDR